jgi:DoxX-like family
MYIATIVVSVLLAAILVVSAQGKLARKQLQVEAMETVGFPVKYMGWLAAAELAGAAGLLVGLYCWPIGVAAAAGVILYFLGATVSHIRVKDWHITPAVVLLAAAVVAIALRLLSR